MLEGHISLFRVEHKKKSIYCGRDEKEAAKHYFQIEPEATAEEPVEWLAIVVTEGRGPKLVEIARQSIARAPEEPAVAVSLTAERDDT